MNKLTFFIVLILIVSCFNNKKYIGIQPYGNFDSKLIDIVSNDVKETYGNDIVVLPKRDLPDNAFINIKSPRYRADTLLKDLKKYLNDSIEFIIGLTEKDISITNRTADGKVKEPESKYLDWGVFGLGYRPGPTCVVSTYRLYNDNHDIIIDRFKKICIHELGHNFGLKHCTTEGCVMMDAAETIKTIDKVGFGLCLKCKNRIE